MRQKRGVWTVFEDQILIDYVKGYGEGHWSNVPTNTGLKRRAKSCRFRWLNYLKPDIKRGNITEQEEDLIVRMHKLLGNRWSLIAGRLPGRTDNEIKNYWNTVLSKKVDAFHFIPTKHKKRKASSLEVASNPIGLPEAESYFGDAMIDNSEERDPKCGCTGNCDGNTMPSPDVKVPERFEFHDDAMTRFSCSTGSDNENEFMFDFDARDVSKVIVSDFAELSDFSEWYQAQ